MNRALVVAWKEVIELLRDRKSIALMTVSAFIFPLLGLVITGLRAQQQAQVAVLDCDNGSLAARFAAMLAEALRETPGLRPILLVRGVNTTACAMPKGVVAAVIIPPGFTSNATALSKPVYFRLLRLVGDTAAQQAANVIESVAATLASKISLERIERLASMAGVSVNPRYVRNPVYMVSMNVRPGGAPAPPKLVEEANVARFLAFSVFFVLNPAAIAVADAITRERESGTGELLAITPVTGAELLLGKTAGALIAAAIAGGLDAAAAIAYVYFSTGGVNPWLITVHVTSVVLAVLVTAAVTMLITLLLPGQRVASLTASMVTGLATLIFLAALFVDFGTLPVAVRAVFYAVPYTYTVLAIESYALGHALEAAAYLAILTGLTAVSLAAAAKLYSPERMVKRG